MPNNYSNITVNKHASFSSFGHARMQREPEQQQNTHVQPQQQQRNHCDVVVATATLCDMQQRQQQPPNQWRTIYPYDNVNHKHYHNFDISVKSNATHPTAVNSGCVGTCRGDDCFRITTNDSDVMRMIHEIPISNGIHTLVVSPRLRRLE